MAEDKAKQEKKNRPLTQEQDRYVKKLGIEKSLKGVNPLSYEALQKLITYFKENQDINLSQIQDEENVYKLFTKALNKGLFPSQGKNAVEFLKALKGSPEERRIAKKFISDLAHGGEPTSVSKEKEALKQIEEARSQSDVDNATGKVGTTMNLISTTMPVWEKFSAILDKSERTQQNYKPEKLPQQVNTRIKQISALNTTIQEANKLQRELKKHLSSGDPEKDPALKQLVQITEKRIEALEKKMDKLMFEIMGESGTEITPELLEKFTKKLLEINKEITPYMECEINKADVLRRLSQSAGVQNINNTKTFKIKKVNRDGKVFSSERERIGIKEIFFDKDKEDDPEVIGQPMIKYVYLDREGKENKIEEISEVNFIKDFIHLMDGYEDETIARIPPEKDYKPEKGEVFSSATLGQFKIEDIKGDKIITNKELKAVPKEWLAKNLKNNEELCQDQKKKEFNKKEFIKILLQHSCSAGENAEEFLPDKILEDPMYPESLKDPQKEGREEVKKLEDDIEKEVGERTDELIKDLEDEEIGAEKRRKPQEEIVNENEKKYWEEAVPYEKIHKVNDMEKGMEPNALKKFYDDTTFLSVSDIFHLVKACWDYHIRRFETKQKGKYSKIARNLPYFGGEMERINQASENEEVHQYKEAYEKKGVTFIQDRMRVTNDVYEMKACFEVLCQKGQMRFEDIDIWRNMNKFLPHTKYIPIPRNGDPTTIIEDKNEHSPFYMKTGVSVLESGIDHLWGPGTYGEWFSQNKSTYASGCKKFYEEGKQLEGVQGEHTRRLTELLREHKEGNFVDPQQFEGLILHSIEAGKVDLETKVYFMVAGVVAQNPQGRSLLPYDRIAHINSEMLARFPIMEYMCAGAPRLLADGKTTKSERFGLEDYKNWLNYFDGGDKENCAPTQNVTRFIWKYLIPSEKTHTRINKALRNAEGMDHDDMHAYLPPASTEVLTNACKTVGGGGKHLLTIEGYANAVAGFDEYMRNLSLNGQKKQLAQAFCSYVRYEGILMKKYDKWGKEGFVRMDDRTLNKRCVVTPNAPRLYINELNPLTLRIAEEYDKKGHPELLKLVKLTQLDSKDWDPSNRKDKRTQDKVQHAYDTFDDVFMRTIKTDGGNLMLKVTKEAAQKELDDKGIAKSGGLTGLRTKYKEVGGELKTMEEWN